MNNIGSEWTIEQTKALFDMCAAARTEGKSLSYAFGKMADETGRSVNSVRNYYYSQTKTFELVPEAARNMGITLSGVKRDAFVPFAPAEVTRLVEHVLTAKAAGKSVRAAILELAGGDGKTALRLQNKYRSVLRSHRDEVQRIMSGLAARGIEYWDPYAVTGHDNFTRLTEYIASLDESRVGRFLSIIEKLT